MEVIVVEQRESPKMLSNPSQTSESFEQRLNPHPELRAKFEVLLSVVENAQGDLILADAAEQRVIEELRQLGQVALEAVCKEALRTTRPFTGSSG
jgi:hypothetical protein